MKPTDGGEIIVDLDKYAIYRNEIANVLVAIPKDKNEEMWTLVRSYGSFEKVPEANTVACNIFHFDLAQRKNTFTDSIKIFPVNQLSSIFIWQKRF